MTKNIIVGLLKLVAGLIFLVAMILLGVFVLSSMIQYFLGAGFNADAANTFAVCTTIFVLGLVIGGMAMAALELYDRKKQKA